MRIDRHLIALALATLVLLVSSAAATPAQLAKGEVQAKQGIGPTDRSILESREAGKGHAWLESVLIKRGAAIDRQLFDLLSVNALKIRVGERGRANEALLPGERQAILGAFSRLPKKVVDRILVEELAAVPSLADRCTVLEIVATIDVYVGEEALDCMLEWAQLEGERVRLPRSVRSAFGEHLNSFLVRCPEATSLVPDLYGRANHSLLPSFLVAIRGETTPARLDALASFLGAVPRFDVHVLAEIKVMLGHARFVPSKRLRTKVRPYISSGDRAVVVEAISIEELVADPAAFPALLDHLSSKDKDLRRRALSALTKVSGELLDPTAETWDAWHARTTAWWRGEYPRYAELAQHAKPGAAARAIQELAMLRAYRHELVPVFASVLERKEVELVVLATASLGHQRSMDAIPHLVAQLEKDNVDIRRAAYHALRRMTGENYSDDPEAWRAAGWGAERPWPLPHGATASPSGRKSKINPTPR